MKLSDLSEANASRVARWHQNDNSEWSGADWSNAMCGEAGEAANVVKKLRRIETGSLKQLDTPTQWDLENMLANELADVVIYADLLAQHYGLDLETCIEMKFNEVSEKNGFPERVSIK